MRKYYVHFEALPVGALFSASGYTWHKRSTRTAEIISDWFKYSHWHTFNAADQCVITKDELKRVLL